MNTTDREQGLNRLTGIGIPESNPFYLHYKPFHEDLLAALKEYSTGKLLDIGCGNKPYYQIVSPLIDEYIGCDIIQSSDQRVDILCPANYIPLPDETFDTVISTQTIEHVEDHQGLLNEAFRLLKPQGHLILSGPMYWPLHEEPYDFFRFTKYGLSYLLSKSGFKVIDIKSNGGKWTVAGQAFLHAYVTDVRRFKSVRGRIFRRVFKMFGGVGAVNRLFLRLDEKYPDPTNTMNYVVIARK
ncbi:MAG TPA: class I SAM-dependent methyltransferase [Mucilaginibacter sp.]|nr:class I SAM-dependent methyltransferase [Mucilaginibacter sp.]